MPHRIFAFALLCTAPLGLAPGRASAQGAPLREQALAAEQAHDPHVAEQAWQQLLAESPRDAEAAAHLGLNYALEGQYARAIPAYRKAAALDPALPGLQMDLGLALFKNAQPADAVEPLEAAARQDPGDTRAKLLLGMAQYGAGRYADAVPNLRTGVALSPANLQLRFTLAQSCLWAKDYTCALEEGRLLLEQDPASAEADLIAGEALDAKGDSPGAVAQFRAAEAANANLPNLHFGLGYLLWKDSRYAEAEPEFQKELALEPRHTQALTYLGDLAIKKNDWPAARMLLEKAAAQPNPVPLTYVGLGAVNAHEKRDADAVENFRRAIALAPDNYDAHYRLARLEQAMGNTQEARSEFAKVQKLHKAKDTVLAEQITQPKQP